MSEYQQPSDHERMRELRELTSGLCDGQLDPQQAVRLEELIRADAECCRYYIEAMQVHAGLRRHFGGGAQDAASLIAADAPEFAVAVPRASRGTAWRQSLAVAVGAMSVAAALLVGGFYLARYSQPGALTASRGAEFDDRTSAMRKIAGLDLTTACRAQTSPDGRSLVIEMPDGRRSELTLAHSVQSAVGLLVPASSNLNAERVMIDDFDDDALSQEWIQSTVLAVPGNDAVTKFDTTANADQLTFHFTTSTNNAVQTLLLRDDFALLNDGDSIEATVTVHGPNDTVQIFGGLVIESATRAPADRVNLLAFIVDGTGRIVAQQNGVDNNRVHDAAPRGTSAILRVQRVSATQVALLYSVDGGAYFEPLGGDGFTYNVAGFNSLGFIGGNARVSFGDSYVTFDNLTITRVSAPESYVVLPL